MISHIKHNKYELITKKQAFNWGNRQITGEYENRMSERGVLLS